MPNTTSLLEQARAESDLKAGKCAFAAWCEAQPPLLVAEITSCLNDAHVKTAAFHRVLARECDFPLSKSIITHHRSGSCVCR